MFGERVRLGFVLPLAEKLTGTCTSSWLRQIEIMNQWSREEIEAWQNKQLQHFVKHAYEHTAYYKRLFDELGIKPTDILEAKDLKIVPVVTKDIVKQHFLEFVPDDIDEIPHRKDKTGGTTGVPMSYYTDENVWGYLTASKIYSWRTMGYRYGDKFAALGSSSLFGKKASLKRRIYDWIRQEKGLNSLELSDGLCAKYFEKMRKERIHFIYGYASAVYLMAKYAKENNLDVSYVKGAFTTSENLTDTYRDTIESTFHCRVMDSYGARDAGITAFEVEPGKYPISYDVIPEIIDEFDEGEGTLLSTCFLNNAFPLMRYDFGDSVRIDFSDDNYNCAVLTKINGRASDVIKLDNGHVLTSPGYTVLMNKFDVEAYRIRRISGSEVKIQIQPLEGKWTKEQEKLLCNEMNRFIGDGCSLLVEYVDKFEPLENGKHRFFYNE